MHKSMEQQNREDHREDEGSGPIELTADDVKAKMPRMGLPSYYRYFAIDLDGSTKFTGYVQRPAAEKNILRRGMGIWDAREEKILVQPDEDTRFDRLNAARASLAKDLKDIENRIAELRTFVQERRADNV